MLRELIVPRTWPFAWAVLLPLQEPNRSAFFLLIHIRQDILFFQKIFQSLCIGHSHPSIFRSRVLQQLDFHFKPDNPIILQLLLCDLGLFLSLLTLRLRNVAFLNFAFAVFVLDCITPLSVPLFSWIDLRSDGMCIPPLSLLICWVAIPVQMGKVWT